MARTKNARMPTVKTDEELRAVLDLAYARLQGYPPSSPERAKIQEQIADLERRLGKSGGAAGGVANERRTGPTIADDSGLRQPETVPVDMARPAPSASSPEPDPLADLRD